MYAELEVDIIHQGNYCSPKGYSDKSIGKSFFKMNHNIHLWITIYTKGPTPKIANKIWAKNQEH